MIQKYKLIIACMFCTLLIGFTACSSDNTKPQGAPHIDSSPSELSGIENVKTYPVPKENRHGKDSSSICSSSTLDGYYSIAAGVVSFHDAQIGQSIALCAQPGCSHNDETCQAWIGKVKNFVEYHGDILAIRESDDGSLDFIKKTLSTGEVDIIEKWSCGDNDYYDIYLGTIADNIAVINVIHNITSWRGNELITTEEKNYYRCDLDSGEMRQMFPQEDASLLEVWAISKEYAVVRYSSPVIGEDEYYEQYGKDADYYEYLYSVQKLELRLYDMNTYDYTVITTSDRDGFIPTVDPNINYGDIVVYQCDDTIYLYDLSTGKETAFLTMEGIINYWVLDHKVFMITNDEICKIYYADFDDAVPIRLGNGGNTETMEFSIIGEGESFFIGQHSSVISKEDFYYDRY